MRGVPLEQPVAVTAELEEVVLLLHVIDRPAVDRAVAVDQLVLGVVRLTRDAVEAFVRAELDVARLVAGVQQLLDALVVPSVGRADEVVVRDVEELPGLAVALHRRVGPLTWRDSPGLGGLLHFQPVLVGAREVVHLLTEGAVPPSHGVADHRGIHVPDVGHVVHVVDRCCQVVPAHERRLPVTFQRLG